MITRRFSVLLAALVLFVPLACGKDSGGDDGVASISESSDDGSSDDDSGSGDGGRPSQEEFQDAALEHAQCMREQGIEDFPDPEFEGEGEGEVRIRLPEGIDRDELAEAEEECQPIMEEVAPEPGEIDPERQAEMVDQMVEVAQCMRERGHDFPDPEVDNRGRVTFGGGPGPGGRGEGPDEDFEQDMEDCQEQAGMETPGGRTRTGGGSGSGGEA